MPSNTNRRRDRRGEKGLTLVELLVVLLIIGLIMAFAAPQVLRYLGGSKVTAAEVQLKRLDGVLELYSLDNGGFPTEAQGLSALVEQPAAAARWNGPYLKNADALIDPWGRPYVYTVQDGAFNLVSLGSDGAEGGDGDATDLSLR